MAGIFDTYRRHKKLVFGLLLLAMVLFLVGTNLIDRFDRRGRNQDAVVATWHHGTIHSSDLVIAQRDISQLRRVQRDLFYGVNSNVPISNATPEQALQHIVILKKAEQMGIVVGPEVVKERITRFRSDRSVNELRAVLSNKNNYVSEEEFYRMIMESEKISRVIRLLGSGVTASTPAESYAMYLGEKQQISAEALPLPVASFVNKNETLDEATLKGFFEKHKEEYPSPGNPGFRRPYAAKFQCFRANMDDFVLKSEGEITDEQVKDYYDKHRDQFKESDLLNDDSKKDETKKEEAKKEEPKKDDAKKVDSKKEEATTSDADLFKEKEGEKKSDAPAPPAGENKDKPASATPPKSDPAAPKTDDKSSGVDRELISPIGAKFAQFNLQDDPKKDAALSATPKTDATPKADEKKVDVAKSADESKATDNKTAAPDSKLLDTKKIDEAKNTPEVPRAKSKYKPLDQVKGEIRKYLARGPAAKKAVEALDKANTTVKEFGTARAQWNLNKTIGKKDMKEPLAPAFAEIAKQNGLQSIDTELFTLAEFVKTSGLSGLFLPNPQGPPVNFTHKAYSGQLSEYTPERVFDEGGNLYSIWLKEDRKESVPKYEEAKEDVVNTLRLIEATKLAEKRAIELTNLSQKDPKASLKDIVATEIKQEVLEIGPFSWMSRRDFAPNQPPTLNSIPKIIEPGSGFMRSVYALDLNQAGVAWNEPRTIVYVVRPTKIDFSVVYWADSFRSDYGLRSEYRDNETHSAISRKWFSAIENEMGLKRDKSFGQKGAPQSQSDE